MEYKDLVAAVNDAKRVMAQLDTITNDLASLIAGRLQSGRVRHSTLCALKKELKKYNMHTGNWED